MENLQIIQTILMAIFLIIHIFIWIVIFNFKFLEKTTNFFKSI